MTGGREVMNKSSFVGMAGFLGWKTEQDQGG